MIREVKDIMTESVVSVMPETSLPEAAMILNHGGYTGLPVVDAQNRVVGMFTERNLVTDQSYLNLKTVLRLFSKMEFYKHDSSPIDQELRDIYTIKVKSIMSPSPKTIRETDSIETISVLLSDPTNNPLPVVDENNVLRGILALSDIARLYGVVVKKNVMNPKDLDKQIDLFVNKFQNKFLVVSRFRVSTWFVVSVLFSFVGFAIAMFLIVRISI